MNPNNKTAKFYDIVSQPFVGEEITNEELKLIESLVPQGAKILDVGCGTGRHAIPLAQKGYQVTGIDSSPEMLDELRTKSPKVNVVEGSILDTSNLEPNTYNLITLFWNAFNEIALTEADAVNLLQKLKSLLASNGKILINIDNQETMDLPSQLNYQYEVVDGNHLYRITYTVKSYDPSTRLSQTEERIEQMVDGKVVEAESGVIPQRWWSKAEVAELAKKAGLSLTLRNIPNSGECYLLLNKGL